MLCDLLGLQVTRKAVPHQGLQREIDHFGRPVRGGFYNSFCATSLAGALDTWAGPVEVCADPVTGEVHALRGRNFHAVQFRPESVLTTEGPELLGRVLADLGRVSLPVGRADHHTAPKEQP